VLLKPSQFDDSRALLEVNHDIRRWHFALRRNIQDACGRSRRRFHDGRGSLKKARDSFSLGVVILLGHNGFVRNEIVRAGDLMGH
jgi:hypothetical protein